MPWADGGIDWPLTRAIGVGSEENPDPSLSDGELIESPRTRLVAGHLLTVRRCLCS